MKKTIFLLAILALMLSFQGCSTKIKLSPEDRQKITTVSINENMKQPNEAFIMTKAQSLTGPLGAIILASYNKEDEQKLHALVNSQKFNIQALVKDELYNQLNETSTFKNKIVDKGNASFDIAMSYGLIHSPNAFSSLYFPLLSLMATLKDKNKKILWQAEANLPAFNGIEGQEYDTYFTNYESTKQIYQEAIKIVVKELIKELETN